MRLPGGILAGARRDVPQSTVADPKQHPAPVPWVGDYLFDYSTMERLAEFPPMRPDIHRHRNGMRWLRQLRGQGAGTSRRPTDRAWVMVLRKLQRARGPLYSDKISDIGARFTDPATSPISSRSSGNRGRGLTSCAGGPDRPAGEVGRSATRRARYRCRGIETKTRGRSPLKTQNATL